MSGAHRRTGGAAPSPTHRVSGATGCADGAAAVVLRASDVTRTFDEGRVRPLVHADVEVRAGRSLAVVGASGSGKTTLLNLLGLLDRPDSGTVEVDHVATAHLNERHRARLRARSLGFVFQDSMVDPRRTAAENVALALVFAGVPRDRRPEAAGFALEAADITHRADTLAGNLSGGERQRVAVARAVAHRPPVLLCDEPTGNLDEANTERVFALLEQYAEAGGAVVVVTHDLDLAHRCSSVVRVANGSVTPW